MVRTAFIKTMIEVLKYDKNYKAVEWRDDLIRLLGRADVNFVPQYAFASHGRSGQHWIILLCPNMQLSLCGYIMVLIIRLYS